MALIEDVIFQNPQAIEKLGQMFFNKKCCDTVFLVNEAQFSVSSHLVYVSNAKLDSIVDTHFEHCGDREIRIGPVKHNESFLILLKYMYGVPINFTQTNTAVMCEVLSLCELYEFNEFSEELKSYLSKFNCVDINALVVLLNTSKKHNIKELYKRCTIFAYNSADDLLNHPSFVELQYDVFLDLIKSDWFCTKEIDILRKTLSWHCNNLNISMDCTDTEIQISDLSNEVPVSPVTHPKEKHGLSPISEEKDKLSPILKDNNMKANGSKDTAEDFENGSELNGKNDDEFFDANDTCMVTNELVETMSNENENIASKNTADNFENESHINDNNDGHFEGSISTQDENRISELVKTFSDNVLKALLSHIRLVNISALDMIQFLKLEEVQEYLEFLMSEKYYAHTDKPRRKYDESICNMEVGKVKALVVRKSDLSIVKSIVKRIKYGSCEEKKVLYTAIDKPCTVDFNIRYSLASRGRSESEETFFFEGFKLNICMEKSYVGTSQYALQLSLKCMPEYELWTKWECNTQCDLTMVPTSCVYKSKVLPDAKWNVKLTNESPCVELGTMDWRSQWFSQYVHHKNNIGFLFRIIFTYVKVERSMTANCSE